jgi:MFS family permease
MNSSAFKLFLTLLWLGPGVGLLLYDLWTGEETSMPFWKWRVPLVVPFFIMATLNFVRWRASRSRAKTEPPKLRRRPRREGSEGEPDPAFRFDEPPRSEP